MKKIRYYISILLIRLSYRVSHDFYWDIRMNLNDYLYYSRDWSHDMELDFRTREYKVADRFIRMHRIKIYQALNELDKLVNHPLTLDENQIKYNNKLELEAIERDCKL